MLVNLSNWELPKNIKIAFTDRHDGVSPAPYNSLNLGLHVGDSDDFVLQNRSLLQEKLKLPNEPLWLNQVHGTRVVEHSDFKETLLDADASYSNKPCEVCVVMVADCLPILFASNDGLEVAASHAGWRGLASGIIESTLAKFSSEPKNISAYLGPAIGSNAFTVGQEVYDCFCSNDLIYKQAFIFNTNENKYLANLADLAKLRLQKLGIDKIYNCDICTVSNSNFFSYRRDKITGRMAALIWRSV